LCDLVWCGSKTVYKGRKKKTIEYFAVKSIDKSQRSKVLNEVSVLLPCLNRGPLDRVGRSSVSPGVGSSSFAQVFEVTSLAVRIWLAGVLCASLNTLEPSTRVKLLIAVNTDFTFPVAYNRYGEHGR
jgi:hypothetical protein